MKGKIKNIGSLLILAAVSGHLAASTANFEVEATFKRNPKIWGTYKLSSEKIIIKRGKKVWRKTPPKRIGDMVISDGNLIFVRENKNEGETQIVVDKIPYKKVGKKGYQALAKGHTDKLARLYENDLKESIPHRDLIDGQIDYEKIDCKRKRKSQIVCRLSGELNP